MGSVGEGKGRGNKVGSGWQLERLTRQATLPPRDNFVILATMCDVNYLSVSTPASPAPRSQDITQRTRAQACGSVLRFRRAVASRAHLASLASRPLNSNADANIPRIIERAINKDKSRRSNLSPPSRFKNDVKEKGRERKSQGDLKETLGRGCEMGRGGDKEDGG